MLLAFLVIGNIQITQINRTMTNIKKRENVEIDCTNATVKCRIENECAKGGIKPFHGT